MPVMLLRELQEHVTKCAMADSFLGGSVNTSNGGTACIFASDSQLDLLSATSALTAPYAEVQYLLLSTIIIRSETY